MIILGLILLLAAVIIGVVGVVDNSGSAHSLTNDFSVFGYEVTGSTGTLFLWGIIIGAVGMLGLSMLLAGARRTSRQARHARRELKATRRETVAGADEARPVAAPVQTAPVHNQRSWRHPFGGPSAGPTVAPH
ncbi:hypothetical protein IU449_03750 [Nocardia higoensis]|uniref:LapA family protein n=1 Tax=Nocardia higoensis TaxID=228599 RepID=A0ABS0D9W9_9NOCA|nr:hypothetical protein [Nocardia higoensis]MBF6353669.1 hypothetical protein [Nocardia higoensis]